MSLKFTKQNGTYFVNGQLNLTTTRSFILYFGCILAQNESVIVNIDGVTEIDKDGLEGIKKMTAVAVRNNKAFTIIGSDYEEFYQDINCSQVA